MTQSAEIIRTTDLQVVYPGGTRALNGVSLSIDASEFLVILGRSGAGKSTLLRSLNRLIKPTGGKVFLRGEDITTVAGRRLRRVRQSVGMIFQQFNLIPRLTVLENVMVGRLKDQTGLHRLICLARHFDRDDQERAFRCLSQVGIETLAFQRASQLSGGQQQRVAIARMLAQEPELMLADEPIASLDPDSAGQVMDILQTICREQKIPVIVNLHQVGFAEKYADRIVGMAAGEVVFDSRTRALSKDDIQAIYQQENELVRT